jgi:hypothetical protein
VVILCGWCGKATANLDRCTTCGHVDPERPYVQRGEVAPSAEPDPGRPALDRATVSKRLAEARAALGSPATVAAIAEFLDVSERTVRRWQQMAG